MNLKFYPLLQIFTLVSLLFCFSGCFSSSQEEETVNTFKFEEEDEDYERTAPAQRWNAEFNMIKNPTTGQIPEGIYLRERNAANKVESFSLTATSADKTIPTIGITVKGPNNYGGRTRALGFDIRNNNIVISGGVTGGIWRSTDGGTNWTKVTPAGQIHSLTSVAQDPRNGHQDTWYATTGEISSSAGATGGSYLGYGLFKSTDNGANWTALSNTQSNLESFNSGFDGMSRVIVNPFDGNILISALNTVQRSADGGTTFSTVVGSLANAARGELIYNANSTTVYAAIMAGSGESSIYSANVGAGSYNFTEIRTAADLNPYSAAGVKRVVLTNIANTSSIAAMCELPAAGTCSGGGGTTAVSLQTFNGSTWTDHSNKISNCAGGATTPKVINTQTGYNMCITSKPNDANLLYLGGTEVYRYNLSTDAYEFIGGSQQGANAINLHVDNHLLMFEPGSNDIMWAANDGGLRKTDVTGTIKTTAGSDNGYDWTNRNNGYVTYQYYDADINQTTGSEFVAGGAQDNAFTVQPTTAEALEVGPTVDGTAISLISGTSFSDFTMLAVWQNGGMVKITNGAGAANYIGVQPSGYSQQFHAGLYADPDNKNITYYPTYNPTVSLVRTRNASGLTDGTVSSDASTNWEDMTGIATVVQNVNNNKVSAAAFTRGAGYTASDANRKMYFGTAVGKVLRLNDPAFAAASTAPVDITPSGLTGYVSGIAVNPTDDKEVLVTVSNYGVSSVWHTADASIASPTWTEIEGASGSASALASVRSAMIVKTSTQTIYMIGTSTGVYATDNLNPTGFVNAPPSWERVGTSEIALAVGVRMRLRPADNKVILGTHGNGLFVLSFPAVLPVELTSFTGEGTNKGNLLTWTTAAEQNNTGFEIEKSTDSQTFVKIGFEEGNQTSSESHTYTFLDNPVTDETTYYRLKQLDNDGQFEYSEVISIRNTQASDVSLTLYPNPVKNNLTVENGEGKLSIHNYAGKLLIEKQITDKKQNIDVSNLATGIYILTVEKVNGQIVSRQFVK